MGTSFDVNAFEIRQLLHAQPIVGTVQRTVFGVIKMIADVNLSKKDVVEEVWWWVPLLVVDSVGPV